MDQKAALEQLKLQVVEGNAARCAELTLATLREGVDPWAILNAGLIPGMEEIGERFQRQEAFVPEMLLSARAMSRALELLKAVIGSSEGHYRGKIVIGTVKGDLHDIGKNLVCMMLEGAGFQVIDLGVDVSIDRFLDAVRRERPHVLGMSALLTTTMPVMGEVVRALEEVGLRGSVKVMVGGAPVSSRFAVEIGADAYGANAVEAVALAKSFAASAPGRGMLRYGRMDDPP